LYSATAKLSTNLCETADATIELELLESIECESPTSEVESETELEIEKEATTGCVTTHPVLFSVV